MTIVPKIKDLKKSASVLASTKLFAAKVVDNNDPLKLQRVQIRVKNLHRRVADTDLPWALPVVANLQGNNQVGTMSIPVLGSTVLIEYVDDYTPIYRGTFNQDANKITELVASNYPHCYGFVDRSGNKFIVDTEDDTISLTHLSGTTVTISQDGNVDINSAQSISIGTQQNLALKVAQTLSIDCTTLTVNANAASIKVATSLLLAAASSIFSATAAIVLNAANFTINAALNVVPMNGWATPPVAQPTAPDAVIVPPTTTVARTKPTITGFVDKLDY